ncbi:MBL fold metallo-hydrolase [Collimonas humicola]|uniref:MBL fold metallo-hydrolase n=1 Tax=Collimonas humicola TaxID=2825886 RepID=UPI001B8AC969|nr:MBL fold metallo-hydrolase [Collimonas humicola]
MIFRQLYEPVSSTYTYLIGCEETGHAILIDPVIASMERDLAEMKRLGLTLAYTVDTHIHADHITAALEMKSAIGSKIAAPAYDHLPCTDVGIEEGKPFQVGSITLQPLHTPGHTDGHFAYLFNDRVFTGDALLIDGCGRTDFQNGAADALYSGVRKKLFTLLPSECNLVLRKSFRKAKSALNLGCSKEPEFLPHYGGCRTDIGYMKPRSQR